MLDSIFSGVTIGAVIAVFGFYFFVKKKEGKDWIYAIYFLTILITGVTLYSFGLYYGNDTGITFSPFFVFARSFTGALKALGGDFQISMVSALAQENALYAAAVFIHFVAAEILTFLIIIKLFGKELINKIYVLLNSVRAKYIVVGDSKQAESFLKSLSAKRRRRTTVVLESSNKHKKRDLMFRGFAVVVIRDEQPQRGTDAARVMSEALRAAGLYKTKKSTKLIAMSANDEVNLLASRTVADYISEKVRPVRGNDGNIARLHAEQEEQLESIKLWAYIMYETLERTEHFTFSEFALGRIRFFNPYEVRARKFITETPITSLIPKEWMNTEKARLKNGKENGLGRGYRIGNIFVGFGKANRQLLKKSLCDGQFLGLDYNALVVDASANKFAGHFKNNAPGLFNKKDKNGNILYGAEIHQGSEKYFPPISEGYNIEFFESDVLSSAFYERIFEEIEGGCHKRKEDETSGSHKDTNSDVKDESEHGGTDENCRRGMDYVSVIIALGDDKAGIETALLLRQRLYERRLLKGVSDGRAYDRVRFFVKIKKETVLSDRHLLNDKHDNCDTGSEIVVFGAEEEILCEDYIIHERLDMLARRIANSYWKTSGADGQRTNAVSKWDALTEFKRDSNRYAAMSIRTKLNLLGYELIESDEGEIAEIAKADGAEKRKNKRNSGKAVAARDTNDSVAEEYGQRYGLKTAETQRKEKGKGVFVDFAIRDKAGDIMDSARNNLARLEHQRWCALHLASGWTKLAKSQVDESRRQDERAKQHACITTLEGLSQLRQYQAEKAVGDKGDSDNFIAALSDADTVCYDFDVMDFLLQNLAGSGYRIEPKLR